MNKTVAFLLTVLLSSAAGAKDYVITDFGAVSDTTVLSTEAIQQAIDRCSEAGGGRVVVPAGMYMTGTLVLRSHVNLKQLEAPSSAPEAATNAGKPVRIGHDAPSGAVGGAGMQLLYADHVEDVWLTDITIHHKGGVVQADLPKIDEAMKDEKEREYPEATMWGNLPAKGFYVRHARHVSFQNVEVTTTLPDARPMYIRIDEN